LAITEHRIFLLSPANLGGIRAELLMRDGARSELACRLRNGGAPLGELFSFMSGLYFRGKLAYARAFTSPPPGVPGAYVITAGAGLVPPDTLVTIDWLRAISAIQVDPQNATYREPLNRDSRKLLQAAGTACEIVLLGSIATAKYVEPLSEIFGKQLTFPADFSGRGDMSRGGLMLRCVQAGKSLTHIPLCDAARHASRPPKLAPVTRKKQVG
jgi:hypothetical protein